MIKKFKHFVFTHKVVSSITLILLAIGAYYGYADATNTTATVTKYVVQQAAQGTVIASVSGSGQVQADTSIDVKPQTSENVTKVYVQPGDVVTAGQLLVQLDTTNEAKALEQAQLSMQSTQLSLAKTEEAPATTTLQQDEDAITQAQQAIVTASTSLENDYQTGFDALATSFIDFQNVMMGLQNFVTGTNINKAQDNPDAYVNILPTYLQPNAIPYRNDIQSTYSAAASAYQQNLADYQTANRNSPLATLDALFTETANTAKSISNAAKASSDLLNYVVNNYPSSSSTNPLPTITGTFEADLGNYTNTINGDVSSLGNNQNTILNDKTSITNDNQSLMEKQETLTALQAGPDPLDVQSGQISLQEQQLSLQTAQQNLADDSIRAPIAGTVSAVDAIVGETVPSPAVSIVGEGNEAVVTLNEVDAAKVQLGNQATLTFDAITGLSLAGQVVEIDPVGTVSQGVVNYNVKIGFSQPANTTSSDEVKPGMSVTADIVTQADQNVIAVPNAAVHTQGGASYVLEPATALSSADLATSESGGIELPGGTKMVPVTLGLANDTQTEISSGVNVGDQIITQTISTSASTGSTAAGGTSALRALGVGGGGGAGAATFGGGAGGAGGFRGGAAAGAGAGAAR